MKFTKNWYKIRSVFHITRILYTGIKKKEIIVILTLGKVASTSVYFSLIKQTKKRCFHIHCLSKKGIQRQLEFLKKQNNLKIPPHIRIAQFFRNKILTHRGPIYYIVIIRNPIERLLSAIFEHWENFKFEKFTDVEDKNYKNTIEKINDIFQEENVSNEFDVWIQEELNENLRIDIYSQFFDEEKKYNIYENGKDKLILIKFEDINKIFTKSMKIFLGIEENIMLESHNVSNNKEYKNQYNIVKENFKISKEIIEKFINSRYFQHFYSGQEEEIFKKWSK